MSHLADSDMILPAYTATRERIITLLRSASPDDATRPVPACPEWTIADLAAHIAGLPEDIIAGRVDGAGTDPWTAAQVDRHRGDTLGDLANSLESNAAAFDGVLALIPAPINSQIVMDTVTHEHDLRAALNQPGARDSDAVVVGLGFLLHGRSAQQPDLVAKILDTEIDAWNLMRTLSGRRTAEQITALGLDAAAIIGPMAGSPVSAPTEPVE
jgi:uncharacterized protein (TIGR03083 family)